MKRDALVAERAKKQAELDQPLADLDKEIAVRIAAINGAQVAEKV
jgi:hypothetical protein